MPDDATENQEQVADDQVTDQQTDDQVTASQTDDQTQTQQTEEPAWKSRYRSPDDMFEDVRKFQSEAAKYKQQVDQFQQQQKPPETRNDVSNEDLVNKFVEDPRGFLNEMMAPLQAQIALQDFARAHPDMDSLRGEMASLVQENPAILAHPQGLEMVYNHVRAKADATKLNTAAQITQSHNAEVKATKQTEAFVEGATASRQKTSPVITDDMSVEEMEKILEARKIPFITDDEREYYE